jgi:hypothetical protein
MATDTTRGNRPHSARGDSVVANLVQLLSTQQIVTFTDQWNLMGQPGSPPWNCYEKRLASLS